jgi:hypothetical protein
MRSGGEEDADRAGGLPVAWWPLGGRGGARVGRYVAAGGPGNAGVRRGYSGPGRAAHAVAVESRQQGGLIGDRQGQQLRGQVPILNRMGNDGDAIKIGM